MKLYALRVKFTRMFVEKVHHCPQSEDDEGVEYFTATLTQPSYESMPYFISEYQVSTGKYWPQVRRPYGGPGPSGWYSEGELEVVEFDFTEVKV